jgi:hypothetical protein
MEFTTTISEQDYVAGHRLAQKSVLMAALLVWLYVLLAWLLCEFVIGLVIEPKGLCTVYDGLAVLGLIGLLWIYLPYSVRRRYGKDPSQWGENVVRLGPQGVSEESSTGTSASRTWSVCSHWRESERVFVLRTQSGIYFTFPKACLNVGQQEELRSILAAHLPKK